MNTQLLLQLPQPLAAPDIRIMQLIHEHHPANLTALRELVFPHLTRRDASNTLRTLQSSGLVGALRPYGLTPRGETVLEARA